MTANRNVLIGVVAAVAVVAAYWMLVLSPKREEAASLSDKVTAVQQELTAAQAQLTQYRAAKDSYQSNYATVARLGKAVPEDDDMRSLMIQLDAAARDTEVDFRSIRIGQGSGAAGADAAVTGAATPPPGATVGEAGFMTMPFSFDFKGRFFRLSDFMSRLERFVAVRNQRIDVTGRLLVLESVSLQPDSDGFPNIEAKIGATSYLLPPTQGLTGGATPQGPSTAAPAGTAAGDSNAALTTIAPGGNG
jgi:hypothetical protein